MHVSRHTLPLVVITLLCATGCAAPVDPIVGTWGLEEWELDGEEQLLSYEDDSGELNVLGRLRVDEELNAEMSIKFRVKTEDDGDYREFWWTGPVEEEYDLNYMIRLDGDERTRDLSLSCEMDQPKDEEVELACEGEDFEEQLHEFVFAPA